MSNKSAIVPKFLISRDPPEGGTRKSLLVNTNGSLSFLISRDPPEGGTRKFAKLMICL